MSDPVSRSPPRKPFSWWFVFLKMWMTEFRCGWCISSSLDPTIKPTSTSVSKPQCEGGLFSSLCRIHGLFERSAVHTTAAASAAAVLKEGYRDSSRSHRRLRGRVHEEVTGGSSICASSLKPCCLTSGLAAVLHAVNPDFGSRQAAAVTALIS